MFPSTLLSLAVSIILQGALASAASPSCTSSAYGLQLEKALALSEIFCSNLQTAGFPSSSYSQFYSPPWASLGFTAKGAGTSCDATECRATFNTLMNGCDISNDTLYGSGSLDASCGSYNFTLWDPSVTPSPIGTGHATTTVKAIPPSTSGEAATTPVMSSSSVRQSITSTPSLSGGAASTSGRSASSTASGSPMTTTAAGTMPLYGNSNNNSTSRVSGVPGGNATLSNSKSPSPTSAASGVGSSSTQKAGAARMFLAGEQGDLKARAMGYGLFVVAVVFGTCL